jgi:hypothetical protein
MGKSEGFCQTAAAIAKHPLGGSAAPRKGLASEIHGGIVFAEKKGEKNG